MYLLSSIRCLFLQGNCFLCTVCLEYSDAVVVMAAAPRAASLMEEAVSTGCGRKLMLGDFSGFNVFNFKGVHYAEECEEGLANF